jgi:thiamine-phosphate diphosphorylase
MRGKGLMGPPALVLITDSRRLEREALLAQIEAALAGGVDAVLVREKQMDAARLLAFAARLRQLTRDHGARLLVHTQADIAAAVEADGVHVAAAGIGELPGMRRWLGTQPMSLSASCHTAAELDAAAAAGADFAFLSPAFPTASHPGAPQLGAEGFLRLAAAAPLPVLALGGITPENRGELAGYGVAVIGALLDTADARSAACALGGSCEA